MKNALHNDLSGNMKEDSSQSGDYLQKCRSKNKLLQRDISDALGYETHTYISALENGHETLPLIRYPEYCAMVKANPRRFARTMLKYDYPQIFEMIWGKK